MNLYLRLLRVLLQCLRAPRQELFDSSCCLFRVWPNDCDVNLHMNNGRFLSFMDLGRIYLLARLGLLWPVLKNRWQPVVVAVDINYLRPLNPFQRFRLETQFLTWDEKYFYIEQRFIAGGRLCASALVKGLLLQGHSPVPSQSVVSLLDESLVPPAPSARLRNWNALLQSKAVRK